MEAKERDKIISACYKIPENEVDVGTVHVENIGAWMKARKAVDVAIFKAGAQNAVKWIEEIGFNRDGKGLFITWDEWQAKLKEWGIKNECIRSSNSI